MSITSIPHEVLVGEVPTDATSATCVVTRTDTSAVVANTATHPSTGVYTFTVTDPAYDLTYDFTITTVIGSDTYVTVVAAAGTITPAGSASSSLTSQIVLNLEGRSDLGTVIAGALTDACEEISGYRWRELAQRNETLSTTAGTGYITLPVDLNELLTVWFSVDTPAVQNYRIELISEAEAKSRSWEEGTGTEPVACYREGSRLYLLPGPSSDWDVQLTYRAFLSVATGSVNVTGFDSLLIAYATAQVYESLEHGKETASRWWSVYTRRLQRKLHSQETTGETHQADMRLRQDYRGYRTTFSLPGRSW